MTDSAITGGLSGKMTGGIAGAMLTPAMAETAIFDEGNAREANAPEDMMNTGGSMNNDELDRVLSQRDDIQPSSGFAASVMEAVREEAAAPPPIPFPWKRALPVLIFAGLAVAAVVAAGVVALAQLGRGAVAPQVAFSLRDLLPAYMRGPAGAGAGWTAAGLLAAFISVKLSSRLAGGRA